MQRCDWHSALWQNSASACPVQIALTDPFSGPAAAEVKAQKSLPMKENGAMK
jgi:hypothetical protein